MLERYPDVPVYIHRKGLTAADRGGDLLFTPVGEKNQRYYQEGDTLPLGGLTLRVLETPGHSAGSVCLLVEGQHVLFAGDTLFRCSCGRCDFPGGDYRKMLASLARLASLEGDYRVLPRPRPGDDHGLRAPREPLHAAGYGAMRLTLRGHDDRYAVEQSLLAFFPEERPVYEGETGDSHAEVTLSRGQDLRCRRHGADDTAARRRGAKLAWRITGVADEYERERLRQRAVKLSFFQRRPGCHGRDAPLGRADRHPPGQAGAGACWRRA